MKYKISELCDINSENLSNKDTYKFINYLDTSNLTENKIEEIKMFIVGQDKVPSRAKRKVKKGDILISTVRPNQKHYGIIKNDDIENLIVSTGFAVLRSNNKVNYKYLYNYLTLPSITEYLQGVAETSTTAYPSLKPSIIGDLEIELPSLEEQEKIANILSSLDDKIELNNEMNKTLEEMAQSIFKRWFVDFEFPNENGEPYKSSGGEMVESELGMIPNGWEVKTLDEILDTISVKHKFPNDKIIFLNTSDILDGEVLHNNYSDISSLPGQAKKSIQKGDILYSEIRPKNKRYTFIDFDAEDYVVSTKLMVLRTKGRFNSSMIYFYLTNEDTVNYLQTIAEGRSGTFPQITFNELKKLKICIPMDDTIVELGKFFEDILKIINHNKNQINKLKEIRDTLLPKLMNGEIRV